MLPLALVIHVFLGATTAGTLIIGALLLGFESAGPIIALAVVGLILAFPISWLIARSILQAKR
ncbi:MAG: CTP synthetase [Marinibacterium sp.]